jgi:heme/copper-type cytochrome/quinol oxidase subunit 3
VTDKDGSVASAMLERTQLAAMQAAAEGPAVEAHRRSALDAMTSALRILFVALQLLSFFNEALAVPWPESAAGSVSWLQAFNFDGLSIPRISCLDPTSRYYASFHAKLGGTACAILVLAATSLLGVIFLHRLKNKISFEEFVRRCANEAKKP